MPVAHVSRNTRLASVPEHDLLQKQRSIKRSANHRQSYSLPSVHPQQSTLDLSLQGGHTSYKGKGKEHVDRSIIGEWVVSVDEMDSGLESYASKERVTLVLGG